MDSSGIDANRGFFGSRMVFCLSPRSGRTHPPTWLIQKYPMVASISEKMPGLMSYRQMEEHCHEGQSQRILAGDGR
jgi:hypothetical protein